MKGLVKYTTLLVIAFAVLVGSTGCKQTKTRLPGVWLHERLSTSNLPFEYWIFEDGTLKICKDPAGVVVFGTANYSATPNKIIVSDFPNDYNFYNGKWRVIDIDKDILRIANFDHGGMLTREFTRVE